MPADVDEVYLDDSLERAAESYRRYLAETAERPTSADSFQTQPLCMRSIEDHAFYRLPEERLLALEASFRDPDGLTARDLRDVGIARLNAMVPLLFNINAIRPGTPGQPNRTEMERRRLKGAVDRYPYFSRLELRRNRGRRLPSTTVAGEDPRRRLDK